MRLEPSNLICGLPDVSSTSSEIGMPKIDTVSPVTYCNASIRCAVNASNLKRARSIKGIFSITNASIR